MTQKKLELIIKISINYNLSEIAIIFAFFKEYEVIGTNLLSQNLKLLFFLPYSGLISVLMLLNVVTR